MIKVGQFIYKKSWCPMRTIRVDYLGKERGLGTVFHNNICTGKETPFSYKYYEKEWIIKYKDTK